jgi:secreted PhoX family phosphatase
MGLVRREFLLLLGGGLTGLALGGRQGEGLAAQGNRTGPGPLPFQPVAPSLPLVNDGLSAAAQRQRYRVVRISDKLEIPKGYSQQLIASWGEPVGNGRFGYNNDYLALRILNPQQALLTVNFEYISALPWRQAFAAVVGKPLPYQAVVEGLKSSGGKLDASQLPSNDPLRGQIQELAREALIDQGLGVIRLRRQADGGWQRDPGPEDRRITGLAGLNDPSQRLRSSGPAVAVFQQRQRQGYNDGLGDRIIGSFGNCAGGTTPWGTVLSAEENFQSQVPEAVYADGSSFPPAARPFLCTEKELNGLGNPFGLAGNKYGWMVELNPADPTDPGTKHTALGRFRHEAVAVKAEAGQPLVVYSGCDRRGGHLYKFISQGQVSDPRDPANSALFAKGTLYGAVLQADGTGEWRPLLPSTPVAPLAAPVLVPHSDRQKGGSERLTQPEQVQAYAQRYPSLGDLYPGNGDGQLGAILIDAHYAANAIGITGTARPEDTEIDPRTGDLLIAFTSGLPGEEGIPDPSIFKGPRGQTPWNEGWIMRLSETGNGRFRWRMVATGGEPRDGGLGFANPDNLALDPSGALWMVTDVGTGELNGERNGGAFGNNSCWVLPTGGPQAGQAFCFATGPMESELTGPELSPDGRSLFLAVQHPGELHGVRRQGAEEARSFELQDRSGQGFNQLRWVPLGSNWPDGTANAWPRPGVVAIRRDNGKPLLAP